jgi:hypothetical protein
VSQDSNVRPADQPLDSLEESPLYPTHASRASLTNSVLEPFAALNRDREGLGLSAAGDPP